MAGVAGADAIGRGLVVGGFRGGGAVIGFVARLEGCDKAVPGGADAGRRIGGAIRPEVGVDAFGNGGGISFEGGFAGLRRLTVGFGGGLGRAA